MCHSTLVAHITYSASCTHLYTTHLILSTLFSQYILEDPILTPTEHSIAVRDLTPVSVCCLLHAQHAVSVITGTPQDKQQHDRKCTMGRMTRAGEGPSCPPPLSHFQHVGEGYAPPCCVVPLLTWWGGACPLPIASL